ncbi:hypothetical protein FACS189488_13850 [Betaproteobacteria bacterium]|nr:hypothetical protein FACS189488_13850 [Betaproteobacteria bacterium]
MWDWMGFLREKSKEEFVMLAEKNPEVKKAVAKLMTLTEDEQARMVADARDKMRWDIESRERAALEKQRLEIACIALAEKVPVDMIQRLTGLTLEQIQALTLH